MSPTPALRPNEFAAVADFPEVETGHTVTVLNDGTVLIAGGRVATHRDARVLDSAHLFDPASGTFTSAGPMTHPRAWHEATLLADGRVLITGGSTGAGGSPALATAEIFDPSTGRFQAVASMTSTRVSHAAVRLADGRVLLAGGLRGTSPGGVGTLELVDSAEVFDPHTEHFQAVGSLSQPQSGHSLTLLADGRVLVSDHGAIELFEPDTMSFRTLSLTPPGPQSATVLLPDGRVLILGGRDQERFVPAPGPSSHGSGPASSRAAIFDPVAETLSDAGQMLDVRMSHAAVLLPDGRVLIAGGAQDVHGDLPILASAEIYDPTTQQSQPTGAMATERFGHQLTVLQDGTVLVSGVISAEPVAFAERFLP